MSYRLQSLSLFRTNSRAELRSVLCNIRNQYRFLTFFGVKMTAAIEQVNDNLILIGGESGAGKSACLMNLRNHEGVLYLNCEAGELFA